MPLKTKIALSDKELALVTNVDWILTKQNIIQKVCLLFSDCVTVIDRKIPWKQGFSGISIPSGMPKIYKGENYLGLPYITMDHPAVFDKNDIFTVRTMCWWGNFFSITFHVAGKYKKAIEPVLAELYTALPPELFICSHEEQWHHHFEPQNYLPLHSVRKAEFLSLLRSKDFTKLALKYDIHQFNTIDVQLNAGYKIFGSILSAAQTVK